MEAEAQLAKAKAEIDMNPNLIEVASGMRAPKQKQKEAILDIEPWLYLASSIVFFYYYTQSMDGN